MKCNTKMIFDYIDGTLNDSDMKVLEKHLQSCEACKETINTLKLKKTVGEHNYAASIDVVQSERNSTDDELNNSNKHLFIDKYLSNKKRLKRHASVAFIAIILLGSFMLGKNYTLIMDMKDYATEAFSSDRSFEKELENYTKSIANTPYYNNFTELIEDKQYNVVAGTIVGAAIELPKNLKKEEVDTNIRELLEHGNSLSIYNGLDFTGYLGERVMLLTCVIQEPNNITRELICLMNNLKIISYWESPSIKEDNKKLDSRMLLKGLKSGSFEVASKDITPQVREFVELGDLPQKYTIEMARSNGDVLYNIREDNNNESFHKFLENIENKIDCKVRIASFLGKEEVRIIDLIYRDGNIKATVKTTNGLYEKNVIEYKVLEIRTHKKNSVIFYEGVLEDGGGLTLINEELK